MTEAVGVPNSRPGGSQALATHPAQCWVARRRVAPKEPQLTSQPAVYASVGLLPSPLSCAAAALAAWPPTPLIGTPIVLAALLTRTATPLLCLRLAARALAACMPDLGRSLRAWSHILPVYLRYRLAALIGRALPALAAGCWARTHAWGGRAMYVMVLDVGGYYHKSCQILAAKADFLPRQWTERLAPLWDALPPKAWPRIAPAVARELLEAPAGCTLAAAFASIEPTALAAASIAQVHAASLRAPPPWAPRPACVLKVQHAGAERAMAADLRNLGRVARFLRHILPFDIAPIVAEIQGAMPREYDFLREARMQTTIRARLLEGVPGVVIPRPIPSLCSRGLLVMERLDGIALSRLLTPPPPGATAAQRATWAGDRAAAAAALPALAAAYGRMLLLDGLVHADPHPGNLMLLPDGRIGILDFGQTKRLSTAQRTALARLVIALAAADAAAVASAMAAAGFAVQAADGGQPSAADVAALGFIIFDTRRLPEALGDDANPLTSPLLRRNRLAGLGGGGFNGGLYMVIRTMTLLRSLVFGLDVDFSMSSQWAGDAEAALRLSEAETLLVDAENEALDA